LGFLGTTIGNPKSKIGWASRYRKAQNPLTFRLSSPKFELIINLNAAKQIGLTIPPNVLARADKVIK
jgi:putative ABC transport system substrate-binding protein